jgi:hypothetical protein
MITDDCCFGKEDVVLHQVSQNNVRQPSQASLAKAAFYPCLTLTRQGKNDKLYRQMAKHIAHSPSSFKHDRE